MSDDPTADFLAREKAILGASRLVRWDYGHSQLTSGDDADLFASGDVPSQPSGIDAFPDICELSMVGRQLTDSWSS